MIIAGSISMKTVIYGMGKIFEKNKDMINCESVVTRTDNP